MGTRGTTSVARLALLALVVGSLLIGGQSQAMAQEDQAYGFWDSDSCYYEWDHLTFLFTVIECDPANYHTYDDACFYHWVNGAWTVQNCEVINPDGSTVLSVHYTDGTVLSYNGQYWTHLFIEWRSGQVFQLWVNAPGYGWLTYHQLSRLSAGSSTVVGAENPPVQDTAETVTIAGLDLTEETFNNLSARELAQLDQIQASQNRAIERILAPNCTSSYNGC